jgi:hypothetical protein
MMRQSEESSARNFEAMASKQALSNAWYCVAVGHGRNLSSSSTGTPPIFPQAAPAAANPCFPYGNILTQNTHQLDSLGLFRERVLRYPLTACQVESHGQTDLSCLTLDIFENKLHFTVVDASDTDVGQQFANAQIDRRIQAIGLEIFVPGTISAPSLPASSTSIGCRLRQSGEERLIVCDLDTNSTCH